MEENKGGEAIRLFCGFCGHRDDYRKRTSHGSYGSKRGVSAAIFCKGCGRKLNQKNRC